MKSKILNITNGDAFNSYFLSEYGGKAVPFREAMMDGGTVSDIYSPEFIGLRSDELKVTCEEYRRNMLVYDALNENEYTELHLWFGKDTFCQMNLVTLLAYLEQARYSAKVVLNYIDDETFEVLESNIDLELGMYDSLYKMILISKQMPRETAKLDGEAIKLYFDYHSDNGALAQKVRDNSNMERIDLICLLLNNSKEYGLSDIQAEELIKRYAK